MDDFLCSFSDLAEKWTSNVFFLIAFNIILLVLWLILGVDFANIFISIITAELVLVGAGANRRGNKAIHTKLDEIIHSLSEARDDLMGVENKSEKVIDEVRKES